MIFLPDPKELNVTLVSENYETHAVILILEWTHMHSASYYISVSPQLELRFDGSTRVQLTALYNTQYNVSVVASYSCHHHGQHSDNIDLYYG